MMRRLAALLDAVLLAGANFAILAAIVLAVLRWTVLGGRRGRG